LVLEPPPSLVPAAALGGAGLQRPWVGWTPEGRL